MMFRGYCRSMDLGSGCGTIASPMSAARWICMIVLVGLFAFRATDAHAQVFKPRGNTKPGPMAKASTSASTPASSTASSTASSPAGGKKTASASTPVAASAKKPTRSANGPTSRRGTAPAKKSRGAGRAKDDSDPVVIDDDDDDVKITDD